MSEEQTQMLARKLTPRTNEYIPISPTIRQSVFLLLDDVLEVLFGGAAGGGKALDLSTLIPTPHGFTPMRDIHPNDIVFGSDGTPCVVEAESEVMTLDGWRLLFDDGTEVVCNDDHLWHTCTASDLASLTRRNPEFRANRRATRPSRINPNPVNPSVQTLTLERNQTDNPAISLPPPSGSVKTTREIVDTLTTPRGRSNHAIPTTGPLYLPHRDLPLDPYLLGCWLGDGTSREGHVTSMDPEIITAFIDAGFLVRSINTKPDNLASTYLFDLSLKRALEKVGVIGNKHIPIHYLFASEAQRLALLQGLMDTDGGVAGSSVEFSNTNRDLVEGVAFLLRSFGMKANVREFIPKIKGRECGVAWMVKVTANRTVFRLSRKASTQSISTRRTTKFRYLKSAERVHAVEMKCIKVSAPNSLFLASEHLIPTHNSEALLAAAAQYVDTPGYSAMIFRRTYRDLALPGALMSRSKQWWQQANAKWDSQNYQWRFPSGAVIQFGYLENDSDHLRYQSAEFQYVGFDELTQFTENQYLYMFSRMRRLRSAKDVPIRMRGATNPGGPGHSWVKKRFNLPTGRTGDSSRVFVPSRLEDNPYLDQEIYERSMEQLSSVTYAQLRQGDWDAQAFGGRLDPNWFQIIAPEELPPYRFWEGQVRHWDLASSKVTESVPNPDWTAGCRLIRATRLPERLYDTLASNDLEVPPPPYWYIHSIHRAREDAGGVEELLSRVAHSDGRIVPISIEQERGASGKLIIESYRNNVLKGFDLHRFWLPGDKETRMRPMTARAKEGKVFLVDGPWVEAFRDEVGLYGIDDKSIHDDQIDALSGGFHQIDKIARLVPSRALQY